VFVDNFSTRANIQSTVIKKVSILASVVLYPSQQLMGQNANPTNCGIAACNNAAMAVADSMSSCF
jgi:hypothetical protein